MKRLLLVVRTTAIVLLGIATISVASNITTGGGGGVTFPLISTTLGAVNNNVLQAPGNAGSGVYFPNLNQIGLSANGVGVMTCISSGNCTLNPSGAQLVLNGTGGGMFWASDGVSFTSPAGNEITLIGSGQQSIFHGYGEFDQTKTSNYSINATTDCHSLFSNQGAAGAVTFTLPGITAGTEYTFVVLTAQTLTVQASGSATIRLAASVSATNGTAAASTVGNVIHIVAMASGSQWVIVDSVGTWAIT